MPDVSAKVQKDDAQTPFLTMFESTVRGDLMTNSPLNQGSVDNEFPNDETTIDDRMSTSSSQSCASHIDGILPASSSTYGPNQTLSYEPMQITTYEDNKIPSCENSQITSYQANEISTYKVAKIKSYEDDEVTPYEESAIARYDELEHSTYDLSHIKPYDANEITTYEGDELPQYEGRCKDDEIQSYQGDGISPYEGYEVTSYEGNAIPTYEGGESTAYNGNEIMNEMLFLNHSLESNFHQTGFISDNGVWSRMMITTGFVDGTFKPLLFDTMYSLIPLRFVWPNLNIAERC